MNWAAIKVIKKSIIKYLIMSAANEELPSACDSQPFVEDENKSRCPTDECTDESSSAGGQVGHTTRKPQFSGPCSFFVSLVGYSMGTSDFWRFPYLVFRNGGGMSVLLKMFLLLKCFILIYYVYRTKTVTKLRWYLSDMHLKMQRIHDIAIFFL